MGKFAKKLIRWLDSSLNGSDQSPVAEPLPTSEYELQAYILNDPERAKRYIAAKRAEVDAEMEGKARIVRMICWTVLAIFIMTLGAASLVFLSHGNHIRVRGFHVPWKALGISGVSLMAAIFSAVKWGRKLLTALGIAKKKPNGKEIPPPSVSPPP